MRSCLPTRRVWRAPPCARGVPTAATRRRGHRIRSPWAYQDPEWKRLPWAPRAPVLAHRSLWIVEATPTDPYYFFKKIELGIDKETFQGALSRKFDGRGRLVRSLQFLMYASWPIEAGGEQLITPASSMGLVLAENGEQRRATAAGVSPPSTSVHERRVPLDPSLFLLDRLSAGK